ncbi:hypothetical protein QFC24_004444 [Naganishia onofrii]|uniref:Uncharacterized protein n=1 Tax=Naganishia onofrii TaxID=1851511 RepID=A0ACC2XDU9_9TREE|nr:hypothetical protein QFC24_004444 [Naganishia onofrii]
MSQPADPWKSHKAKASSLSVLWNPIKRVPLGTEGGGGGGGMQSGIRYISSPIHSLDADGHGNGNGTGFVFPVQVQADQLSGSTMDTASTPVRAAVNTNSKGNGTIMSSPASSPSSVEKKRAYSLRKIFLHRKSNSTHSPLSTTMSTGFNNSDNASPPPALSPSISAPWGLTVASFRPAPVPHHHHHYGQASLDSSEPIPQQQQQPDLRELRLEDTMLVSRESDSNGLLAQQRARDMPVPQEAFFSPPRPQQQQQQQAQQQQHRQGKTTALTRSTSLGNPLTTTTTTTTTTRTISSTTTTTAAAGKTPERPKRYEASTLCEKFILPRPRLVAHSITPPTSPTFHLSAPPPFSPPQPQMQLQPQKQKQQQETTTDSYAQQPEVARIGRRSALLVYEEEQRRQQRAAGAGSPALSVLSGTRVLQEGKERDWEREEWAARAGAARASSLSAAAIGGGGGGAGRLRMRLASTTRDGDRERDTRYLQARFAPMPVAYERVQGGGHLEVQKREAEQEEEMVSPPLGGRKKSRSGSLGDLLAGPFMRRDRGAVDTANEGTVSDHSGKRLLEPVRTSSSSQQHHHHRQQRPRRSSEPSLLATLPVAQPSSSSSSRFTFLRQLTQSPHSKAPQLHHARVASLPMVMALNMDKPLPPDPVETDSGSSSDAGGGEKRRSRVVRYSASSPDLRSLGLVDLPPVLAPSHGQMGSRNSALNLLSRSDVVDRLAHPLTDGHGTSSGRRFPPSPIQVVADSAEETGTMAQEEGEGQGPFTPTRQAAWEQWHTSTIQLRSPDSPLPERLPAETVRKLAERQAKSPRQKKPSMEEAVNRARIAKQLFGDLPSSPTPPPPPLPVPHSPNVEGYQHSHVGSTSPTVATSWQHDRLLYAAFTGNHSPHSPRRYGEGSGSPQRTRLAPPTPGSTEASPMPGASFEDIERVGLT